MTEQTPVPDRLGATGGEFGDALRQPAGPTSANILRAGSADIVAAAAKGDREAVRQVLSAARHVAVRYCRARIGRQDGTFATADSAANEVCAAVLRALPSQIGAERSLLGLVCALARGEVDHVGRETRQEALDPMRVLPDRQREILVLRVIIGLSAEETAEALGLTAGAVRVQQHRALGRLRKALNAG
ncbi:MULTISPECIES: sigma factor-like helix-turn-helix DNA-binding protein [unclassified Amycolatopsis]|uniref:sigma factor-like helix-turn-helix DNA-binding protein n=1 Tax=unclassified Amycolatopsis TaxID=2618356 RepID=UPI0034524E94